MTTHTFALVLDGFHELTDEVENCIYEAGCDDALLSIRDGTPLLDFDRHAKSLREAILSAIEDIEGAGVNACVIRVEPDDLVTASDIAKRTNRSREGVRLLAAGKRGRGGFPPQVHGVKSRTRLWRWAEVAAWLSKHVDFDEDHAVKDARTIAAINGALELRHHAPEFSSDLVRRLARRG